MTLQELLEHAHLDALGQLDEREQAAFEAAFAVAPPAIKAQVRHEQARWSPMEHLLPQVEPPAELRERVLDAVTAAMVANAGSEVSAGTNRRVSPVWRAASIGLMSAVVVLSAAFVYVYSANGQNARNSQIGRTDEFTLSAFRTYMRDAVVSPSTQRTFFARPDGSTFKGAGAVWTNPDWKASRLFFDVPQNSGNSDYRIVEITDKGELVRELDRFTSDGLLRSRELRVTPGTRLALVLSEVGKPVSRELELLMTVTV